MFTGFFYCFGRGPLIKHARMWAVCVDQICLWLLSFFFFICLFRSSVNSCRKAIFQTSLCFTVKNIKNSQSTACPSLPMSAFSSDCASYSSCKRYGVELIMWGSWSRLNAAFMSCWNYCNYEMNDRNLSSGRLQTRELFISLPALVYQIHALTHFCILLPNLYDTNP